MAFTFTPRQLRRRSEFYYQLSQLTGAGISLPAALEQLHRNPPGQSYRDPVRELITHLNQGSTFSEALRRLGSFVSAFEYSLLYAGEQSGRLDACFKLLADYFKHRAQVATQVITDLLYPAFLFHFAVLIFSFVKFVGGWDWSRMVIQILSIILPVYVLLFLGIYATQSAHGEKWRSLMERVFAAVPMLGAGRRSLALGRLAAALEALLSAGVSIIEAWELAGAACGSPDLRRTVQAWRPLVNGGVTPAEAVIASRKFPTIFSGQYSTGEISGSLDVTLKRLHAYYEEEGTSKLHAFAQWTPRAIYLLVVLMIAFQIVQWWSNYFKMVGNAGGF